MSYDHATHAGNAGDVFKHLLLAEAAQSHLSRIGPEGNLLYAESHCGAPGYELSPGGQWIRGIARLWPPSQALVGLTYFKVLLDMNKAGLSYYPGSAAIVMKAASMSGRVVEAELWDTNPAVGRSWARFDQCQHLVRFHMGDGFSGVRRLLMKSGPGLLLVDSPGTDPGDLERALGLIADAARSGWVAMSWHIQNQSSNQDPFEDSSEFDVYSLNFREAGMDGGRWPGCMVLVSGADPELRDRLLDTVNILLRCR